MQIDFFYFDLNTCSRCKQTKLNLTNVLNELGLLTNLKMHKLNDHQEFVEGFGSVVSPSIFVDGEDIFKKVETSKCDECSQICGDSVSCRAESDESDSFSKESIKKAILVIS
ncbi:MAG: DUF2703 domain-containing protein [Patescibacteria group bacterium]